MKQKFITAAAAVLLSSMLFTSCPKNVNIEETTAESTTEETTTEKVTEESTTEETTKEKTTDAANPVPNKKPTKPETTTARPKAEPKTEATTYPQEPQIIGISSKGYDIVQEKGFTYVNGILIANKTYALPSSYNPGGLLSSCTSAFKEMQAAAAAEGLNLYISSGFRSYSTQSGLYSKYCARDGKAAADRYSARAGHSEHQTGLAIDLNTIQYSFADTPEGKWVAQNCHKYGFILRYPENKEAMTGYRYEPWHIRYLGKDMAAAVYNSGLCLEEYLGITSVYP